jgi:hypothetical protein
MDDDVPLEEYVALREAAKLVVDAHFNGYTTPVAAALDALRELLEYG